MTGNLKWIQISLLLSQKRSYVYRKALGKKKAIMVLLKTQIVKCIWFLKLKKVLSEMAVINLISTTVLIKV